MTEPVETVAKAPQKAAKGLSGVFKGKPVWLWVAGGVVLLGVAYFTFSRRNVEDPEAADTGESTTPGSDAYDSYDDYGVPTYVTSGSQGAYGGYDVPQDLSPVISDNAGTPEGSPITVNVNYPAPTGGGKPAATGAATHAPVAGGAKRWKGHPLSWWQNPAHGSKMVKVGKKSVRRWRWPTGQPGYVHTRPFGGHG